MLVAALSPRIELDRTATALVEAEPDPACLLGEGGEILAVNTAWDAFARQNGGAPGCLGENLLGKNYFNYIDGVGPRTYYESVWHRALGGARVTFESECNTGATLRQISCSFRPLKIGPTIAVLVSHQVVRQREVSELTAPLDPAPWIGGDGQLVMCSACRSARRADGAGWGFVPGLIGLSAVTPLYTFCPSCEARLLRWGPRGTRATQAGTEGALCAVLAGKAMTFQLACLWARSLRRQFRTRRGAE
jgi:hypothetical protein